MSSKINRSRARLVTFAACAALVLAGCRGGEGTATVGEGKVLVIRGSMPFSGPLASYGTVSKGLEACFEKVNADGGVGGREIDYAATDDGYEPTRAVTNARRFMQKDRAFATITFGGPPSLAVAPIATQSKGLHLAFAGNSPLSKTKENPFSRAWLPNNSDEAKAVTEHVIDQNPDAKIGVLFVNSDTGIDYLDGVREAVEAQESATIVKEAVYEVTDATVNSQVNQLRRAGADTVVAIPLGAVPFQMMSYIKQIGWNPVVTINESSSGIKATMSKMGDTANGVLSAQYVKDPADPQYADDKAVDDYRAQAAKYGGGADADDYNTMKGYALCQAMVAVIGELDDPTPAAFIEAWDRLEPMDLGVLLGGVQLAAGEGGRLINDFQINEFVDGTWKPVEKP